MIWKIDQCISNQFLLHGLNHLNFILETIQSIHIQGLSKLNNNTRTRILIRTTDDSCSNRCSHICRNICPHLPKLIQIRQYLVNLFMIMSTFSIDNVLQYYHKFDNQIRPLRETTLSKLLKTSLEHILLISHLSTILSLFVET